MKIDSDRQAAYNALIAIEKDGSYSNLKLSAILGDKNGYNQAFVRNLVYGVIEKKLFLDYILNKFIKKGINSTKLNVIILLRMGLYQILFMDSVPDYAAVSESVALARKYARGMDGFTNGVLRSFLRNRDEALAIDIDDKSEYLSIKYSCGVKLVKALESMIGSGNTERFLAHAQERASLSIRVNSAKISVDELIVRLQNKNYAVEKSKLSSRALLIKGDSITELDEYKQGLFSIQSEESCAIADFAAAKSSELVVELCAAPGGKTAAMAEAMQIDAKQQNEDRNIENKNVLIKKQGKIIALELYKHRCELIKATASRLKLDNVEVICQDAGVCVESLLEKADLVLADVPCSGLGVIRKKPEIKYKDNFNFDELIKIQMKILETGCKYVKPGGRLVYSTCTINPNENELLIEKFLNAHKEFISEDEIKLSPLHNGYDGFYMNKLRKAGKETS